MHFVHRFQKKIFILFLETYLIDNKFFFNYDICNILSIVWRIYILSVFTTFINVFFYHQYCNFLSLMYFHHESYIYFLNIFLNHSFLKDMCIRINKSYIFIFHLWNILYIKQFSWTKMFNIFIFFFILLSY